MVNRYNYRGMQRIQNGVTRNAQSQCCAENNARESAPMEQGMSSDCKTLMAKLRKLDFSIVDTVLYLDMYPDCKKALAYYNKLLSERAEIRKALAEKCHRPMSSFENESETDWDWIRSPWPWDLGAN